MKPSYLVALVAILFILVYVLFATGYTPITWKKNKRHRTLPDNVKHDKIEPPKPTIATRNLDFVETLDDEIMLFENGLANTFTMA